MKRIIILLCSILLSTVCLNAINKNRNFIQMDCNRLNNNSKIGKGNRSNIILLTAAYDLSNIYVYVDKNIKQIEINLSYESGGTIYYNVSSLSAESENKFYINSLKKGKYYIELLVDNEYYYYGYFEVTP